MKIPLLTKLESYFRGVVLEQASSIHNPQLNIILDKGQVQLCTKDAIYSYGNKYYNFRNSFERIDFSKYGINDVLLLGLGLGSVPLLLEKIFHQKFNYTAVEIDEVIVELAHKYLLSELKSFIEVFPYDASLFFETDHRSYDMIIMDIFQSAEVPKEFETVEFFEQLHNRLTPNGLLLFNRLATNEEDEKKNILFEQSFKTVFPNSGFMDIRYNRMFVNDHRFFQR